MNNKLFVALNPSSAENEKVFRDFLQAHGWGWWHWLANFWIIDTGALAYSPQQLSADLYRIFPVIYHFVAQLPPDASWWAYGPHTTGLDMFPWLQTNLAQGQQLFIPEQGQSPAKLGDRS